MASKKKTEEARSESTLAAAVAGIDREALAPKTRLYALAKQVGVASKELVAQFAQMGIKKSAQSSLCLLYTSPSPRDGLLSRMPSSA